MMVEVIVNKKPKSVVIPIDWKSLPGGTIVEFHDKSIGLVYSASAYLEKGMVIISGLGDPTVADGYRSTEITKILGKLTKIVVEEL